MVETPKIAPRLKLVSLVAATYFIVSGGPYGLEELIAKSGYSRSLLVLLLTPLLWSLPTALMVGELSSALPEDGGYYAWVKRAFGPFWGFQEAWLSLAASVFDMAIYPTLFVLYLGRLVPSLGQGAPALGVGALMIAGCALWNLRGGAAVGKGSLLLGGLLLAPFFILALCAVAQPAEVAAPAQRGESLLAGLFVAMWNFMGWDNASTFAGEVERPQRTYPLAMLATVALVCATYVVPVAAAQLAGLDAREWTSGSWVTAAADVGGPWLGRAVVAGGLISAIGSFNSLLLSYSRLPVVLARDGYLPRIFAARRAGNGAPWVAIVACSLAYASCLGLGFSRLIQLDIVLYGLSLSLEFAALVALRLREPLLPRPFRVPGGPWAAALLGVPPMALLLLALVAGAREEGGAAAMSLALALTWAGPAVYWLAAWRNSRQRGPPATELTAR